MNENYYKQPWLLHVDNFTPLSRTPWAGNWITEKFKKDLCLPNKNSLVGEAWEISTDQEFPSHIINFDRSSLLYQLIENNPRLALSPFFVEKGRTQCTLLIKTLFAAMPLSLQVHPRDDDPHLKSNECGKPESWYVIDCEPGAGIYLGFSQPLTQSELKSFLVGDMDLTPYLQFVPLKPGDYYEINPHTPHAVGPGVLLLEPQRVLPNKSGKTFRLWDWSRKYNQAGQLDSEEGKKRELHVESSLRLIDPSTQCGPSFVESLKRTPQLSELGKKDGAVQLKSFPQNKYYQLKILTMSKNQSITMSEKAGYAVGLVLGGSLTISGTNGIQYQVQKGQPIFFPWGASSFTFYGNDGGIIALIIPEGGDIEFVNPP